MREKPYDCNDRWEALCQNHTIQHQRTQKVEIYECYKWERLLSEVIPHNTSWNSNKRETL